MDKQGEMEPSTAIARRPLDYEIVQRPLATNPDETFRSGEIETMISDFHTRIEDGTISSPLAINRIGEFIVSSLLNEATQAPSESQSEDGTKWRSLAEIFGSWPGQVVLQMQDIIRQSGIEHSPPTGGIGHMAKSAMDYAPDNSAL